MLEDRPILVNEFSASKGKKDPPPRPQARNRDFWQGFPRGTQTNFGPATCCFLLCSLPPPFPSPPENLLAVVIYPLRIFRSYTNDLWHGRFCEFSRDTCFLYRFNLSPRRRHPRNRKTPGGVEKWLGYRKWPGVDHMLLIALKAIHHPCVFPFSSFREQDL